MRKVWSLVLSLPLAFAAIAAEAAEPVSAEAAQEIFSRHDSNGRLAHTVITKVGDVFIGGRIISIFDLSFVNPISHHGMQQIAIVEGEQLLGVYQTEGAVITISGTRIGFACSAYDASLGPELCDASASDSIDLSTAKLPARMLISGYVTEIRDSV